MKRPDNEQVNPLARERRAGGYRTQAAFVAAFNAEWRARHGADAEGRLTTGTYSRYERGDLIPRTVQGRLARFLGVSTSKFLEK